MTKSYSELKKGDLVQAKFGDKMFIGVFKAFRGSDDNFPKKSGGTINFSHYASVAFGRQSKAVSKDNLQVMNEKEIQERLEDCKMAYAYFLKFHQKD
jgi:hypothetical protein